MAERDLEKLLGGYATGTLTEEERQALYTAALQDQHLFDALADEEALRQLLADPAIRRRVVAALEQTASRSSGTWAVWITERLRQPRTWAIAGGLAVALLAVTTVTRLLDQVGPMSGQPQAVTEESIPFPGAIADADGDRAEDRRKTVREDDVRPSAARPTARREPGPEDTAGQRTPAPAERVDSEAKSGGAPLADVSGPGAPQLLAEAEGLSLPGVKAGRARELFYGAGTGADVAEAGKPSASVGLSQDALRSAEAVKKERFAESQRAPKPSRPAAPEERALLGLRYRIQKKSPSGVFAPTDPDGPFTVHDAVRLLLDVNTPGHLYVLKQDSPGIWSLVYPFTLSLPAEADQATRVIPGAVYTLPPGDAFHLEGRAGRSRFLVLFAREPQPGLRPYLSPQPPGEAGKAPRVLTPSTLIQDISAAEASPTLLVEKATEPTAGGAPDPSVYVVNPSRDLRAHILAEIRFSY